MPTNPCAAIAEMAACGRHAGVAVTGVVAASVDGTIGIEYVWLWPAFSLSRFRCATDLTLPAQYAQGATRWASGVCVRGCARCLNHAGVPRARCLRGEPMSSLSPAAMALATATAASKAVL